MSGPRPTGVELLPVPSGFPGRVDFVKSAADIRQAPHLALPEVCVCGRSNVGKSSLINTLCGRRQLARVSSTPGRTRLINFFNVQDTVTLVDLPGYGWARVPREMQAAWGETIQEYLAARPQLVLAVVLVDLRREPGVEEIQLVEWFHHFDLPVLIVATKADKVPSSRRNGRRQRVGKELGVPTRDVVPFSSLSREGRDLVWGTILAHARRGSPRGGPSAGAP